MRVAASPSIGQFVRSVQRALSVDAAATPFSLSSKDGDSVYMRFYPPCFIASLQELHRSIMLRNRSLVLRYRIFSLLISIAERNLRSIDRSGLPREEESSLLIPAPHNSSFQETLGSSAPKSKSTCYSMFSIKKKKNFFGVSTVQSMPNTTHLAHTSIRPWQRLALSRDRDITEQEAATPVSRPPRAI